MSGRRVLVAVLGAVLVVSACGGAEPTNNTGGTSSPTAKGDQGDGTYVAPDVPETGEAVIGYSAPYTAYNNKTADANSFSNSLVLNQVLTSPFIIDGDLNFLLNADVMESVELTSRDPQVVTYRIKPGVTWSDGAAWDCDDFYLAWLAMSGHAVELGPDGRPVRDAQGNPHTLFNPASTTGLEDVGRAECQDNLTFVEYYDQPFVDWRGNYIRRSLLPAHILEQQTGIQDITALDPDDVTDQEQLRAAGQFWNTGWNGFDANLMPASGPYQLDTVDVQGSATVILTRNPRWVGNPGGPERLVFRNIADPTAQAQALENQELNVITPQAEATVAERLRAMTGQGIVYESSGGLTFEHLDLNLDNPLLAQDAVREAIAHCINRDDLVDKLIRAVDPEAAPLGSMHYMPQQDGYVDNYSDIMTSDVDRAKQILEEAGWTLAPDGIYVKDGQRLSFSISTTDIPRRRRTVQLIQEHCRQAGMEITADLDPNFLDQRVSEGDYEAALFYWIATPFDTAAEPLFTSNGNLNWNGYSNQRVDELWAQATQEFDDARRQDMIQEIDRIVAQDRVALPLFQLPNMWAYSDSVDSVYYQPMDGITWNANEWEIS